MQTRTSNGLRTALISCAMGAQWGQGLVFAMGNDLGTATEDGCHYELGCNPSVFQHMRPLYYTQPPTAGMDWFGYLAGAAMFMSIAGIGYCLMKMPRRPPFIPLGNGSIESSEEEQSEDEQSEEYNYNVDQVEEIENRHERRLNEAGFTGQIPEHFIDPVSRSIMVEPVILITDNHTTSQSLEADIAITLMRHSKPICPLSRRPFDGYILNRDLKNLIQAWVDKTVAECEKKNLNELPRALSRQRLLDAQGMFAHRKPKPASQPLQKRERSLSVSVYKVGMR